MTPPPGQAIIDLVLGEFMQMGSKEDVQERFSHYIQKTFKKTASLIAYTCKAVAYLSGADEELQEAAFQYGRNLGIAFQLVDDLLDFVSNQAELGKPAANDLKLGLATAPVLFACEKFPELNDMIIRRFSEPGDVEAAYDAVMKVSRLRGTADCPFSTHTNSRNCPLSSRVTAFTTRECWLASTLTRQPDTLHNCPTVLRSRR